MNEENQTRIMIEKILNTLSSLFVKGRPLPDMQQTYSIVCDLEQLFNQYSKLNPVECGKLVIKRYIKLINLLLVLETNQERKVEYYNKLENAYRLGARVSLEHFIIYYEWNWNKEDKLLENRYPILGAYVYYLNKMCWDRSLEGIVVNLPSGYGKCIDENSKILTNNGYVLAKNLKVGDLVYSMNENKECEEQPILNIWKSNKPQIKVTLRDNVSINISPEHRMLTQRGYIQAKDLEETDYLYELRSKKELKKKYPELEKIEYKDFVFSKIKSIEKNDTKINMLDFEIAKNHNFILNGFVSHNSRTCRYYEAFRLGLDPTGTFLALCSNDALIKGQSRSVIDIIKNPRFGDVFPHLRYSKDNKDFFLKETDGEWKLKDCKLVSSYYANTVNSNVVGVRANLSIDIDDLYGGYIEALNENLNKQYYNDFVTVWRKRYVLQLTPQIIISGTLWSPTDFLAKVIMSWQKDSDFIDDPIFKYTSISKDGKKVIIRVPALDYETGQSTCPEFKTTEELLKEKSTMSTYLWETNFQQNAISPEGLYFDWSNLQTYDKLPMKETNDCFAVLDPNRQGNDYISMPVFNKISEKHYLVDCFFSNKSVKGCYKEICDTIIRNNIRFLAVENNTDTSIAEVLYEKLAERQYYNIKIVDKYNTKSKLDRIKEFMDVIVRNIVFPCKIMYGIGTMMGKAMEQLTTFSFEHPNRHDDMIDSLALYADQIIEENGMPMKALPFVRPF